MGSRACRKRTSAAAGGRALLLAAIGGCVLLSVACGSLSRPSDTPPTPTSEAGVRRAGGELLAGPEIKAVLGGKAVRYRWTAAGGAKGQAIVTDGSAIRLIWATGAVNGRIRFSETGYCSRYRDVREGREDCYRMYRVGPRAYEVFREDGQYSGSIVIES